MVEPETAHLLPLAMTTAAVGPKNRFDIAIKIYRLSKKERA
jgi:hypothetical protein